MTWLGSLLAKMRRKPAEEPGLLYYDVRAVMKNVYPKPVEASLILRWVARVEEEERGFTPPMRLIDLTTGEPITGPILDEDNVAVEVDLRQVP